MLLRHRFRGVVKYFEEPAFENTKQVNPLMPIQFRVHVLLKSPCDWSGSEHHFRVVNAGTVAGQPKLCN